MHRRLCNGTSIRMDFGKNFFFAQSIVSKIFFSKKFLETFLKKNFFNILEAFYLTTYLSRRIVKIESEGKRAAIEKS